MRTKTQLFRLPGGTIAYLEMNSVGKILKDKMIDPKGDAQIFHTQNVLRRIKRYMPFRTGMTYKVTVAQTDARKPEIVTDVPYGKYLYYGKTTVNHKTGKGAALVPGVGYRYRKGTILRPTGKNLIYTKTKNPKAGPHWDRTLVACEGRALTADLQRFVDRRNK